MKFKVYNHKLVVGRRLIERHFIVLEHDDGLLSFTDWHKYIVLSYHRDDGASQHGVTRFHFVIQFLNYAFFSRDIHRLQDITVDDAKAFLQDFASCRLPGDTEKTHRNRKTVDRCMDYITSFLDLLIADKSVNCKIRKKDLYKKALKRDKRGKVYEIDVPVFDVVCPRKTTVPQVRDIPDEAFHILLQYIVDNHTDMLGVVLAQAFAGLRPSEACNLRRNDSPLGPGILFHQIDWEVYKIELDLREEMNLRSDHVSVGFIKKERLQAVPRQFLNVFLAAYNIYTAHMSSRKFEKDFGPFSINSRGKALTYDCYRDRFHKIVQEVRPIFLSSDIPEVVMFGEILLDHKISPHIFRHWYTVQLVLSGMKENDLAYWRGDSSYESAREYCNNKGPLEKQYRLVNDAAFEYLNWRAKKVKENEVLND